MQMKPNLYISCPVSVSEETLKSFDMAATMLGSNVQYWTRGTAYNEENKIKNCDFFVLILPDLKWKHNISSLPIGCKKELQIARGAGRKIFLGYRDGTGTHRFYKVSFDANGLISGLVGTSDNLRDEIKRFQSVQDPRHPSAPSEVLPMKAYSCPTIVEVGNYTSYRHTADQFIPGPYLSVEQDNRILLLL